MNLQGMLIRVREHMIHGGNVPSSGCTLTFTLPKLGLGYPLAFDHRVRVRVRG